MSSLSFTPAPRFFWVDHLRALAFTLLVFDHCAHAYAEKYARFHFFKDFQGGILGDILYLHNNSIIMPLLFFTFGLFIFSNLNKKGLKNFFKDRFLKLGIPYIIGIPFVVPLLVFPRYQALTEPFLSYPEFWQEVYFQKMMQGGGPFWVLFCLFLFTCIALSLAKLIPPFVPFLGRVIHKARLRPFTFLFIFIGVSALVLGGSDLRWGAPWWIGLDPLTNSESGWGFFINKITSLFRLQGSRFLLHALYFTLGIAVGVSGLLTKADFWRKLSIKWPLWLTLMLITGGVYITYTLHFFENGAYTDVIHRSVRLGKISWLDTWPLVKEHAPLILWRTTLHAFFCTFQALAYSTLSYRFLNTKIPLLCSLAACSYGIFLLHEVPVIWGQYWLSSVNLPPVVKIVLLFGIGGGATWAFVAGLRHLPGAKRIIG